MTQLDWKDMSKAQFDSACKRWGFRQVGFLGYYEIGGGISVSVLNAGPRRRDQLRYLIAAKAKAEAEAR